MTNSTINLSNGHSRNSAAQQDIEHDRNSSNSGLGERRKFYIKNIN